MPQYAQVTFTLEDDFVVDDVEESIPLQSVRTGKGSKKSDVEWIQVPAARCRPACPLADTVRGASRLAQTRRRPCGMSFRPTSAPSGAARRMTWRSAHRQSRPGQHTLVRTRVDWSPAPSHRLVVHSAVDGFYVINIPLGVNFWDPVTVSNDASGRTSVFIEFVVLATNAEGVPVQTTVLAQVSAVTSLLACIFISVHALTEGVVRPGPAGSGRGDPVVQRRGGDRCE